MLQQLPPVRLERLRIPCAEPGSRRGAVRGRSPLAAGAKGCQTDGQTDRQGRRGLRSRCRERRERDSAGAAQELQDSQTDKGGCGREGGREKSRPLLWLPPPRPQPEPHPCPSSPPASLQETHRSTPRGSARVCVQSRTFSACTHALCTLCGPGPGTPRPSHGSLTEAPLPRCPQVTLAFGISTWPSLG